MALSIAESYPNSTVLEPQTLPLHRAQEKAIATIKSESSKVGFGGQWL